MRGLLPGDVQSIINNEWIRTVFQPIVSLRKGEVIGFEALSRVNSPEDIGVSAEQLFSSASRSGCVMALDSLCWKTALSSFPQIETTAELVLSLNVDASIFNDGTGGSRGIRELTDDAGYTPSSIILEISESAMSDPGALEEFVCRQRQDGFLIAIDDLGKAYSNLDRINLLKPDIIKLDRVLLSGLDGDAWKQEVLFSLVDMGRRTGSLVLGEGVERLEEAVVALDLGVEFFQGYLFSPPLAREHLTGRSVPGLEEISVQFEQRKRAHLNRRKRLFQSLNRISNAICCQLVMGDATSFSEKLRRYIGSNKTIECMYVLDAKGIQITPTVHRHDLVVRNPFLFRPPDQGTDHSLQEYCMPIRYGLKYFVTEKYLSLATGALCRTVTRSFDYEGGRAMLCMDFREELSLR